MIPSTSYFSKLVTYPINRLREGMTQMLLLGVGCPGSLLRPCPLHTSIKAHAPPTSPYFLPCSAYEFERTNCVLSFPTTTINGTTFYHKGMLEWVVNLYQERTQKDLLILTASPSSEIQDRGGEIQGREVEIVPSCG